jgi:membrane protease YdiL (CAAX protease family)
MEKTLSLSNRSQRLAGHFWQRLMGTPLLLGWLVAGLLIALLIDGWRGLLLAAVNLLLLGLYVLLIRALTRHPRAPAPVRRPRLELAAALALLGALFLVQLFDFGVWAAQPWQAWVRGFFAQAAGWVRALGLPAWAAPAAMPALSSVIKQLLPTLLLFVALGYGPRAMGLTRPYPRLTAVLVGVTAALGLITGVLLRAPLWQTLALYGIGIFINALPEELFFRGMLLPRLERVLSNPLNALVVSALLFNAIHVPLAISQGQPWPAALASIFRVDYPTGLLWGYLYLRTRSILPGVLWHAANGRLGFLFMDL